MLAAIQDYAVRNQMVHSNLFELIKKGQYHVLTKQIYDDLCYIPLIILPSEYRHKHLVARLLEGIIDTWFIRDEGDRDNYQLWMPTSKLQEYIKTFRKAETVDEGAVNQELSDSIVEIFALSSGFTSSKLHAEGERERVEQMKRDWGKMLNLVQGEKRLSDIYLGDYR